MLTNLRSRHKASIKMGNREVIVIQKEVDEWVNRHQPMAKEKLSAASLVSIRTIHDLFNGKAPRMPRTRYQLAQAMGKPVESLFRPMKVKKTG